MNNQFDEKRKRQQKNILIQLVLFAKYGLIFNKLLKLSKGKHIQ